MPTNADARVESHGSVFLVSPLSEAADDWLRNNTSTEGWEWIGGSLAVDHRCVGRLVEGMLDAGLEVV